MSKPVNRTDAEGRKAKCDGACSCKKHDRAPLRAPLKLALDSADCARVKQIAESIYVHKTRTTDLTDTERADMESYIRWFGYADALSKDKYNRHPHYIAGVFIAGLQRYGVKVAQDAARERARETTVAPRKVTAKEREAAAKDAMRRESATAWTKGSKK